VKEHLYARYESWGGGHLARITASRHEENDWIFGYLLDIQRRAYELAMSIAVRGHWQSEWYPGGDYSTKPVLSLD
jgi:hypothetical protein